MTLYVLYTYTIHTKGGDTVEKPNVSRLTFNIPSGLLERLDEYADSMSVNRTSAICFLLSQALSSQKALSDLSVLANAVNAQNGKCDE